MEPYNSTGAPHLANYQSAVFSPFSAPFYVVPFRWALVIAPMLKLFGLGLFTYLFLRRLRLGSFAALVGGLAFMFSGYTVVWLGWPHTAAQVALPASLWSVGGFLQSAGTRRLGWLAGFAVVTAVGLLAGHPETFYFGELVVVAYAILRCCQRGRSWRQRAGELVQLGGAGLLGVGVAAIQLLPFFEYLGLSTTHGARDAWTQKLSAHLLPLQLYPNLLGNPTTRYYDQAVLGNFNEASGPYLGFVVVLLAVLGVTLCLRGPRRRLVRFFAATAAVGRLRTTRWGHGSPSRGCRGSARSPPAGVIRSGCSLSPCWRRAARTTLGLGDEPAA